MIKRLFALLVLCLVCLPWIKDTYGQSCPEAALQTTGSHRFSQEGEIVDIPILVADCQPIALELRWSNGRNNGSNLKVSFLDTNSQPIFVKKLSGFQTGNFQFPFTSLEPRPWQGSRSMLFVPANVTIQAVPPFAFPATISYTVTREAGPSRRKHPDLDAKVAMNLRIAAGKLLSKGQSSLHGGAVGSGESITYSLEEVELPEAGELEIRGRRETLEVAFRLRLTGGESLAGAGLIWIDDAALPVFRRRDARDGSQEVGALIYDRSVLKDGAEISVSEDDGSLIGTLAEPLTMPNTVRGRVQTPAVDGERAGEVNAIVGIHRAVRTIGATRQSLVQIELKTNRPIPAREAALQLQIGKRFFLDELSGDHSGRTLTLTLTPEMFAGLKQGAEIVAFFNKPDRSGLSDRNIWHFGRLDKRMLNSQ